MRQATLAIFCAFTLGMIAARGWSSSQSTDAGEGRVQVVSPDGLTLATTQGTEIGKLRVTDLGPQLSLPGVELFYGERSSEPFVQVGDGDEQLTINAHTDPTFTRSKASASVRSHSTPETTSDVVGRDLKATWHLIAPGSSVEPLRHVVATEDVRLKDRDGNLFAVLGTESGMPKVVFVDKRGFPRIVWGVFENGATSVNVYNMFDEWKVLVDMFPGRRPRLTILEPGSGEMPETWSLDATGANEVRIGTKDQEGELGWMSPVSVGIPKSIMLVDQRNNVIWKP